jgi:hypothetical protein
MELNLNKLVLIRIFFSPMLSSKRDSWVLLLIKGQCDEVPPQTYVFCILTYDGY